MKITISHIFKIIFEHVRDRRNSIDMHKNNRK